MANGISLEEVNRNAMARALHHPVDVTATIPVPMERSRPDDQFSLPDTGSYTSAQGDVPDVKYAHSVSSNSDDEMNCNSF